MQSICPRLGMKFEPTLPTEFPSSRNYCFQCQVPTRPKMTHQRTYCLTEAYQEGIVFLQSDQKPFPQDLQSASFDTFRRSLSALLNLTSVIRNLFGKYKDKLPLSTFT